MITGYSNSGKTFVTSKLIELLTGKGCRVATIKHAHHGYEVDTPGKDSWNFFNNGAQEVVVSGPQSYSVHRRVEEELGLEELLLAITDADIILVEGFKSHPGPKIQVYREGHSSGQLPLTPETLAIVSDLETESRVPIFGFEELEELVQLIQARYIEP
jgi:molybdopterin-guanine dinucleotide biosynthesis protein B